MIDTAVIKVKAGKGGDGKVSFRREKYIPKGGPDGGDGGDGGNVYLITDHNMATLLDFKSKPTYEGQNGEAGGSVQMSGAKGEDLYIKVPEGTLVYEILPDRKILLVDMVAQEDESQKVFLLARGGKGGKGNTRFKSSTNRTPIQFTKGTLGDEKDIQLEVKLVADIGLVGKPNAGKSTLINKLTNANAKTASYPFTTLTPNLGTALLKSGQNVIIADIPGLIEGASSGKGLGDDFLRHIERTRVICHVIDPLDGVVFDPDSYDDGKDFSKIVASNAVGCYKTIRQELSEYESDLTSKPELVVVNKCDITEVFEAQPAIEKGLLSIKDVESVVFISAATGEGIELLKDALMRVLDSAPKRTVFEADKIQETKRYTLRDLPNKRIVYNR